MLSTVRMMKISVKMKKFSCMNKKMLKPSPHTQSSPCLPLDVLPQAAGELKFEMFDAHPAASDSDAEDESETKAKVANSDEKD